MPKGVTSLTGFIRKLEVRPVKSGFNTFFRGHSDISHELKPSVFRNHGFQANEKQLLLSLVAESPGEFLSDRYTFDRLVRAQHYGVPTRLLDLTTNPLMALYFACEGSPGQRGQVIQFETPPQSEKFFSSDAVSCKSNLSSLTSDEKARLRKEITSAVRRVTGKSTLTAELEAIRSSDSLAWSKVIDDFNKRPTARRLVQFIKEEKPYFENLVDPVDLLKIEAVFPKKSNARIAAQAGAFLIFGLRTKFPSGGQENVTISVIDISADAKKDILLALEKVGIQENTVYPELERVSAKLKSKFKGDHPMDDLI